MILDQAQRKDYVTHTSPKQQPSVNHRMTLMITLATLMGLITLGLRLVNPSSSFDIFIDETLYLNISENVARDAQVELFNVPFYLHPPMGFYVMGAYLKLVQPTGNMIERIYSLRQLNAILAALTAVMLFLMTIQAAQQLGWGILAAVLFMVDPYIGYMNGRVMLETSAVWWVTIGFWLLLGAVNDGVKLPGLWRAVLIGIFFGLGILSKDMVFFITLVPLVLLFLLKWALPRRFLFVAGLVTVGVYSLYPLSVLLAGQMPQFIEEKFSGLYRMLGSVQMTGMNRSIGPSFVEKLMQLINLYAGTYLFLGLGVVALIFLLTSKQKRHRIIVVWAASAYALLAYSIFFGTLEDQFFYFLSIPVVVLITTSTAYSLYLNYHSVAVVSAYLSQTLEMIKRLATPVALLTLIVIIGWNTARWRIVHTTPTNGYEQALTYLSTQAPSGSRVASSSQIGQFILANGIQRLNPNGPWGLWSDVSDLRRYQPDYVIISLNQLAWDHSDQAKTLLAWLDQNARSVFEFGPVEGSPTGKLIVYDLRSAFVAGK